MMKQYRKYIRGTIKMNWSLLLYVQRYIVYLSFGLKPCKLYINKINSICKWEEY